MLRDEREGRGKREGREVGRKEARKEEEGGKEWKALSLLIAFRVSHSFSYSTSARTKRVSTKGGIHDQGDF